MKFDPGTRRAATSGLSRLRYVSFPLALVCWLVADPAQAQWRTGAVAEPAPLLGSRSGKLAGYAEMVDSAAERLHAAMMELVIYGTVDAQAGVVPPQQQALMDQAQRAWLVVQQTPDDFDDRDVYLAAERQFAESVGRLQRAATSPAEAVEEARRILAAMERLEDAAAAAAAHGG